MDSLVIGIADPGDERILEEEKEKIQEYQDLKEEEIMEGESDGDATGRRS